MGNTLTNTTPANTYQGLLKTSDTSALTSALKAVSDGLGNDSALLISTTSVTNRGGGGLVSNTAFGDTALDSNTTGTDNTAFGYQSLTANTIGTGNTAFGHEALLSSISGVQNTAIGRHALRVNTGSYNRDW